MIPCAQHMATKKKVRAILPSWKERASCSRTEPSQTGVESRIPQTCSEESVILRCSVVSFILGTLTVQQTAEVLNLLLHNGTCSYTEGRWQECI